MRTSSTAGRTSSTAGRANNTFVAGPENRLAVPALERLLAGDELSDGAVLTDQKGSSSRLELFNPLLLMGPTGIGKSHLARGITRRWQALYGDTAVKYFTAIDFARQLRWVREEGAGKLGTGKLGTGKLGTGKLGTGKLGVGKLGVGKEDRLDDFRKQLADLQLLVIEDLQRLPPSRFVQRELRDTLDLLFESGAAVVVTTQQPPATMTGLEAGLRDRLAGGLTVRLQPPGVEARLALLQLAAAACGSPVDAETLLKMAQKTEGTAPQVLRAIAEYQLSATAKESQDEPASSNAVAERGAKRNSHLVRPALEFKQIIAVVARYFSLTQAAVRSSARRKSLVYARGIVIYLARTLTDLSYARIGQALGRRDHSTVMHASRTIEKRLVSDAGAQQDIEELKRILTAA